MTSFEPHAYQRKAIEFALDNDRCGLFLPMGAGKTVTTLTIIQDLLLLGLIQRVLIIGPVRVIQSTWPDEIQKWDHTRDMTYSVVAGTPKQRRKALEKDADIFLIGKENVCWLIDETSEFKFDMVVIDELSTFKNPRSQRFKALRRVMPRVNRYHAFKREKILSIDDEQVMAANAGVLCAQLKQITSGEVYTRENMNGRAVGTKCLHSTKLDALDDLIEAANGNPVLVFYWFQHEKERLLAHLQKDHKSRALTTAKDITDWNTGEIEVLLVHPASAGHGLNLQQGGHIAIWYSLPNWNLELYQQANARIYRQGQTQPVTIYRIMAEGTIDEDEARALETKDVTQKALIEALRR